MRITKEREERRQELISVAEQLFMANGYERTGVSDIVRATGVAQGTFYYHFRSKEEILVAIVQKSVADLESRVVALIGRASLSASERLGLLMLALIDSMMNKRDLIAFVHADENAQIHLRLTGATTRMLHGHLAKLVHEGVKTGEFHVPHVEVAVGFLLSGLGGFLHQPGLLSDPANWPKAHETAGMMIERCLGMESGSLTSRIQT